MSITPTFAWLCHSPPLSIISRFHASLPNCLGYLLQPFQLYGVNDLQQLRYFQFHCFNSFNFFNVFFQYTEMWCTTFVYRSYRDEPINAKTPARYRFWLVTVLFILKYSFKNNFWTTRLQLNPFAQSFSLKKNKDAILTLLNNFKDHNGLKFNIYNLFF